jgi:hypothetical protein
MNLEVNGNKYLMMAAGIDDMFVVLNDLQDDFNSEHKYQVMLIVNGVCNSRVGIMGVPVENHYFDSIMEAQIKYDQLFEDINNMIGFN